MNTTLAFSFRLNLQGLALGKTVLQLQAVHMQDKITITVTNMRSHSIFIYFLKFKSTFKESQVAACTILSLMQPPEVFVPFYFRKIAFFIDAAVITWVVYLSTVSASTYFWDKGGVLNTTYM